VSWSSTKSECNEYIIILERALSRVTATTDFCFGQWPNVSMLVQFLSTMVIDISSSSKNLMISCCLLKKGPIIIIFSYSVYWPVWCQHIHNPNALCNISDIIFTYKALIKTIDNFKIVEWICYAKVLYLQFAEHV
jgi:hypothetical protein